MRSLNKPDQINTEAVAFPESPSSERGLGLLWKQQQDVVWRLAVTSVFAFAAVLHHKESKHFSSPVLPVPTEGTSSPA